MRKNVQCFCRIFLMYVGLSMFPTKSEIFLLHSNLLAILPSRFEPYTPTSRPGEDCWGISSALHPLLNLGMSKHMRCGILSACPFAGAM
jgi:hypothetical protein